MKLIIYNNRIAATATDEYDGPDVCIPAPKDFDITRMHEYRVVDGLLTLPADRRLTRLQFRNRFTVLEKAGFELAALDDPSDTHEQRVSSAVLRAYLADLAAAEYVDLDDPDTIAGLSALESAGILAAGRSAEILA